VEEELRELKESKKAFAELVNELQEKIRVMEVAEASHGSAEKTHQDDAQSKRTGTAAHSVASPSSRSTSSQRPYSTRSHPSLQPDRTLSRLSGAPRNDETSSWTKEVERVRMQRDETAVKLKGMRKTKSDLKKSLKETELQLHNLERQGTP
jgi:predicted CopG family antitoxin